MTDKSMILIPVKVLGVLSPKTISVLLAPNNGQALGVRQDIPLSLVPYPLRIPNSQFTLVYNQITHKFTKTTPPKSSKKI